MAVYFLDTLAITNSGVSLYSNESARKLSTSFHYNLGEVEGNVFKFTPPPTSNDKK